MIYIVSRCNYHQILTEVSICETFLPPNVKKSSRTLYLEMLGTSCSFMLEQDLLAEKKEYRDTVLDNGSGGSFEGLNFGESIKDVGVLANVLPVPRVTETDSKRRANSFDDDLAFEEESSPTDSLLLKYIAKRRNRRNSNPMNQSQSSLNASS